MLTPSLLLNEWRFYLRQPVVWLCFLGLPGLSALLVQGLSADDIQLAKRLTLLNITVTMMTLPIVIGALTPTLLQRDRLSGMQALIDAVPTTLFTRRLNQFVGLMSLTSLLCSLALILQCWILSSHPLFNQTLISTGLKNLLVLMLPACFVYSALALVAAQYFHSALSSYALFGLCWVGYVMLGSITGSPILAGSKILNSQFYHVFLFADPMGFTAIFEQFTSATEYWHFSFALIINRMSWLLFSLLVLWRALVAPAIQINEEKKSKLSEYLSRVTRYRVFPLIILFYGGVVFSEVLAGIAYAEPGSVIEPTSIDALNRVCWDILPFAGCMLMALWSWHLGWEQQRHGFAELTAATPVTNLQLISAQVITLSVGWLMLIITTALATLFAQLVVGSQIQMSAYWLLLSKAGIPILLFGWLCLAMHHLFKRSLIAGGIGLLFLIVKFTPTLNLAGITHPLLDIAGTPLQPADYLIGFSRSDATFWPYLLVWTVIAVALLTLASLVSHRGTGFTTKKWRHLPFAGYGALGLVITTLLTFHFVLKSEKPLISKDAQYALRAEYEKQYQHWEDQPQPVLTYLDAEVDFHPHLRSAQLCLDMQLTNVSQVAITKVLIGSFPGFEPSQLTLDGGTLVHTDSELKQYEFALNTPLQPTETLHVKAQINLTSAAYWLPVGHQILLPEFSYLRGMPLLPYVGFNRQLTLRDTVTRAKFSLPKLAMARPSSFDVFPPKTQQNARPINIHSVVSAPITHSLVAQGEKIKEWQQGDRRYIEFETQHPIHNIPVWIASLQATHTREIITDDHATAVHFIGLSEQLSGKTPSQAETIHQHAVADTLVWFENQLTPYPHSDLSIIFVPEIGLSGYALPQVILMSHRLAIRANKAEDAGFDQRYRRTVHEVAHQWFGHTLGYGVEEDGSFLIESLAKYVELVLIEQRFGQNAMQALVDYEQRRYEYSLRGQLDQPKAIIDASRSADVYSRATLVFAKLRELVGDEVILTALNQLFAQNKPGIHSVTSHDFVTQLLALTPSVHSAEVRALLLGVGLNQPVSLSP